MQRSHTSVHGSAVTVYTTNQKMAFDSTQSQTY